MADIQSRLAMLAERGTRVGPEEMIERVEAELARDPVVVVGTQRKGWKMSDGSATAELNRPWRGKWVAVAAFVIVIAAGVVFSNWRGGDGTDFVAPLPTISTAEQVSDDEALIDGFLNAFFSGDFDLAVTILGGDPAEESTQRDWSEYEAAIGAAVAVECTPRADVQRVYDCDVAYRNDFYDAVDADPEVFVWSGHVLDEDSVEFVDLSKASFDTLVMRSLYDWEREVDYESPCDRGAHPTLQCALFQLEHLDEWADWYRSNR